MAEIGGEGVLLVPGHDATSFGAALSRAITESGLRLSLIDFLTRSEEGRAGLSLRRRRNRGLDKPRPDTI